MAVVLFYLLADDGVTRLSSVEVDIILTGGSTKDSQLTDNPVENGTEITHNQVPKPDAHEVEAVVMDRPMDGTHQPGRARAMWSKLLEVQKSTSMLELMLPLFGSQTSVRLVRFNATFDKSTGDDVLKFSASFRQVEIKFSQRVPAQKRKESKTKGKVELGQQSTIPADASTSEKYQTILFQIFKAATGKEG